MLGYPCDDCGRLLGYDKKVVFDPFKGIHRITCAWKSICERNKREKKEGNHAQG